MIRCAGGAFTIPPELYESLLQNAPSGMVYIRQDEDTLTISPTRIADARKRTLSPTYRIPMFRNVVKLAVIDMNENLRLMAVEWRPPRKTYPSVD